MLLFQAIAPFLAALLAWLFMREAIGLRTWLAMAAALAGVAIMVGGSLGSGSLRGDALCVVMSSGFALVIVITRRHLEISMTPATALGVGDRIRSRRRRSRTSAASRPATSRCSPRSAPARWRSG